MNSSTGKPQECIAAAIAALQDQGFNDPALVRRALRSICDEQLDQLAPLPQSGRRGFSAYLKQESESSLWNTTGDQHRSAAEYRTAAASRFLPVAARELVNDGIDPSQIAAFCIEAALEAFNTSLMSKAEIEDRVLTIVLSYCSSIELRAPAN